MNGEPQFESGAERAHSKTPAQGRKRAQFRPVWECARFAPLWIAIALTLTLPLHAQDWQSHFAKIPIGTRSFRAHLTPPVELILTNFQPSAEIRAVVLMPGAADRLYFYDWGDVTLPENPSLLDAVTALTNAADLRVFLEPPFLLIGRQHDNPTDPLSPAPRTVAQILRLEQRVSRGRAYFLDRSYDRIVPQAEKITRLKLKPSRRSFASWHFYRLSFVGYDLNAAEFLKAIAYGANCSVVVDRKNATFTERSLLDNFPFKGARKAPMPN